MGEITVTREIDGEEVEVSVNPEEHGFISKDDHKSRLNDELTRRLDSAKRKAREGRYTLDELADDDDLLTELRDQRPDLFNPNGNGAGEGGSDGLSEDDVRELRQSWQEKWTRKELEPVVEERDRFKSEAEALRVEKLDREVAEAAHKLGVRETLVPLVKRLYRDEMGWSDDHNEWFRRQGDGFEPSVDDEFDADYVTVLEDLRTRKESGEFDDWFEASGASGGGAPPGSSSGGGQKSLRDKPIREMTDTEKTEYKRALREEHGRDWLDVWEREIYAEHYR